MTSCDRPTNLTGSLLMLWERRKERKKDERWRKEGRREGVYGTCRVQLNESRSSFFLWWADYAVVALRWTLTCVCQWLVTVKQQHKRQELSQEVKSNQLLLLFLIGIQDGRKEMNECHCTKENMVNITRKCYNIIKNMIFWWYFWNLRFLKKVHIDIFNKFCRKFNV